MKTVVEAVMFGMVVVMTMRIMMMTTTANIAKCMLVAYELRILCVISCNINYHK